MCHALQSQYQQHHALCPYGRQPLPVSSPLPPSSAAAADGSPTDSRCDESPDDGGGVDDNNGPTRSRHAGPEPSLTPTPACRTEEVIALPLPPDVTASKSIKAAQNHYL